MGVGGLFDFARQSCDHRLVVGGDFGLCSIYADGARVFFDISIVSVVTCHPSWGRMDLLFVGGVGCPSPRWWVSPERSPSHRGEVLSRGGGGGSACC